MKYLGIFILFLSLSITSVGQMNWYVNFSPGFSFTLPAPLVADQEGFSKISFWAKYKTESFKLPPYYSYRIGFSESGKGWEMEMNHLKIILKNKPNEIKHFSITHGYNQVFVSRSYLKKKVGLKIGVGIVLAHPENIVRDLPLNEKNGLFGSGYYLTGPALQTGLFKEISLNHRFFLLAESKVSIAFTNVPVSGGRAHAPVIAFHLQFGPGIYFIKKERQNWHSL